MIHVTVREHARLTTASVPASLDCHTISSSAFNHLCQLAVGFSKAGAKLVQLESGVALRLDNYVGVVETPCGTLLEILPKHVDDSAPDGSSARAVLTKMLGAVWKLPHRKSGPADIELLRKPLTEWVMRQYLLALDDIVKRGVRFDYLRVEEEARYLRGQLHVAKQALQSPQRRHLLQLRHDIYSPDRAENRLLHSALLRICATTEDPQNWRLAHELATVLNELPVSKDVAGDFRLWRSDRLMAHYQDIRPWCEVVLGNQMPTAQRGRRRGISLLFPMERLFEEYVALRIGAQLPGGTRMKRHAASKFLCRHDGGDMFRLEPDMLVTRPAYSWVLDAKWKMIDAGDRPNKYGLDQGDMYQLLGYGQQYLRGSGELFLVYPRTAKFAVELPAFHFSDTLRLRVVPFDLDSDRLESSDLPFFAEDMVVA